MKFGKKPIVKTALPFMLVAALSLGGLVAVAPKLDVHAAELGGTLPQVSSQRARDIAEAHVGYPARDTLLFVEGGELVYEVDIRNDVLRYMVYVSAMTGDVLRAEDYNISPSPTPTPTPTPKLPLLPTQQAQQFQPSYTQPTYTAYAGANPDQARQVASSFLGRGAIVRHVTKGHYVKVCIQDGNEHHDIRVDYNGNIIGSKMREITYTDYKAWNQNQSGSIGHERAAQIALQQAGGGTVIENRFCYHYYSGTVYHVNVVLDQTEHVFDLITSNGQIIKHNTKSQY